MSCFGTTVNNACATGACYDIDEKNIIEKAPYVCFTGSHCTSALDGALSTRERQGAGLFNSNQFNVNTLYDKNKVYKNAPFYPFMFADDKLPVFKQSYYDSPIPQQQPSSNSGECKRGLTVTHLSILMLAIIFIIRSKK